MTKLLLWLLTGAKLGKVLTTGGSMLLSVVVEALKNAIGDQSG